MMSPTRVVVFARGSDLELARLAVASIPREWELRLVVESRDLASFASCEWLRPEELRVSDFARGKSLHGSEAVLGVARELASAGEGASRVVKFDADSLLIEPGFLEVGGFAGIVHHSRAGAALGLAYSMPAEVARLLPDVLRGWVAKGYNPGGEDESICPAVLALSGIDSRLSTARLYWERYDGRAASPAQVVGHYRWRRGARLAGARDDGDILRMSLEAMSRDAHSLGLARRFDLGGRFDALPPAHRRH
jgi:hypothetical protein